MILLYYGLAIEAGAYIAPVPAFSARLTKKYFTKNCSVKSIELSGFRFFIFSGKVHNIVLCLAQKSLE